ncbi:MAG: sporulation protein YhbH [Chloroflexi bacterium]|jgi:sporulation protein YhbH|nr:sporulation protein YhbH [Chloroflexota bacterium]HLG50264.1 sporulation protein YhbH [Chloroflexota bacterium]
MRWTLDLSRQDWSLHRKGPIDQARHNEKVKEAIKSNLPGIISEEAIITAEGDRIVKVPIRSLDLPHFRYDFGRNKHIGQGEGGSQPGDKVGPAGAGEGKQAGNMPGIDYYEAEITVDEIAALIFEDLGLPNLQQKTAETMETDAYRFTEIAKKGIMSNLDKRRTVLENIKRNALAGRPRFGRIKEDDLRFKIWVPDVRRETNAVVIAMRDVSGSMGEFEKYISRSFYFWMVKFLRTKYNNVRIVFITHHTEAKEVDEETFFKLGESGGTKVSSAYQLALDIIKERFDPNAWNIYPFHFSDGDNWGDVDNRRCVELVNKLLEVSNVFGYGEIREGGVRSSSTLMNAFQAIKNERFIPVIITDKKDVHPALRKFFSPQITPEAVPATAALRIGGRRDDVA